MPQEGAGLLSQVEGLLEQFLELPYETPVKDQVSQVLETVIRPGLEELRSDPEAQPEGEGQGLEEEAPPPEDQEKPPMHETMRAAREQAQNDMEKKEGSFAGEGPKTGKEKSAQAREQLRRRRAKA